MTRQYFMQGKNEKETENIVNSELKKLSIWFSVNKLSLNVKKQTFSLLWKKNIQKIPLL